MGRKITKIICVLFLLLVSYVIFLTIRNTRSSNESFADLIPVSSSIPDEQNGFIALENAREALVYSNEDSRLVLKILKESRWKNSEASLVLENNSAAMTRLAPAFDMPRIVVPPVTRFEQIIPYLKEWKDLATIKTLQASQQFSEGNEKKSFDDLLRVVQLGHKMQDCEGAMIHYLAGGSVKMLAINQLSNQLSHTILSGSDLFPYIARLEALKHNPSAITNVFKVDFIMNSNAIDQVRSAQVPGEQTEERPAIATRIATAPMLNRSRTERTFAAASRAALASAEKPFSEMPILHFVHSITNGKDGGGAILLSILSGNVSGDMLCQMILRAYPTFFARNCQFEFHLSALQTAIAIRCYQLKHKTFPATLDNLVPDFLPKVPTDPFNGKPIGYSAEKKTLYSVGKDLVADNNPVNDLAFRINF